MRRSRRQHSRALLARVRLVERTYKIDGSFQMHSDQGNANPILFAKLNGLFLIAVGLGYLGPMFRPAANRLYMWIFGPLLKGGGALLFVWNYFTHGSPESFLLFAIADGALASWTLVALLKKDSVL